MQQSKQTRSSIAISPETRNLLKSVGRMDQNYNDLILELVALKKNQGDKK
jgi:hypothetical protein